LEIAERNIIVDKTARYFLSFPKDNVVENLVFVVHGYAQLASNFIREFEFLTEHKNLIAAPEGLSKFYSRNVIASSWMTKEDRLNEIKDYVGYLDKLFEKISFEHNVSDAVKIIIGFSQGAHTAARWFVESKYNFHKLILCSSDFPVDADFKKLKQKLNHAKLYYIHGTEDPVLTGSPHFKESLERLKSNGIKFSEMKFKGKHEINKESILRAIGDNQL